MILILDEEDLSMPLQTKEGHNLGQNFSSFHGYDLKLEHLIV